MPQVIELQVYVTTVKNGIVTSASQLTTITITDTDDDGVIDTKEWTAATGTEPGKLRGTEEDASQPALWVGTKKGNLESGELFTSKPYPLGANVKPLIDTLVQNKFEVLFTDLNVCFMAGTMIATPDGERPVEELKAGDLVLTRDHGPQPLVWSANSHVSETQLDRNPNQRPIIVAAGALGDNLPNRSVGVSAQHRILVKDTDGREYLASARHLQAAGHHGFSIVKDHKPFSLYHIACANHEIIMAEGAAMETFFTGPMALRALSQAPRSELIQVFPELEQGTNPMSPARPFMKKKEVEALVKRLPVTAV